MSWRSTPAPASQLSHTWSRMYVKNWAFPNKIHDEDWEVSPELPGTLRKPADFVNCNFSLDSSVFFQWWDVFQSRFWLWSSFQSSDLTQAMISSLRQGVWYGKTNTVNPMLSDRSQEIDLGWWLMCRLFLPLMTRPLCSLGCEYCTFLGGMGSDVNFHSLTVLLVIMPLLPMFQVTARLRLDLRVTTAVTMPVLSISDML